MWKQSVSVKWRNQVICETLKMEKRRRARERHKNMSPQQGDRQLRCIQYKSVLCFNRTLKQIPNYIGNAALLTISIEIRMPSIEIQFNYVSVIGNILPSSQVSIEPKKNAQTSKNLSRNSRFEKEIRVVWNTKKLLYSQSTRAKKQNKITFCAP